MTKEGDLVPRTSEVVAQLYNLTDLVIIDINKTPLEDIKSSRNIPSLKMLTDAVLEVEVGLPFLEDSDVEALNSGEIDSDDDIAGISLINL